MTFTSGDRAQSPVYITGAGGSGNSAQIPQQIKEISMKKHGICDFVPDFPGGKKARKDMVVKIDLTPLMRQMYNDNLEMTEKLGRLEAQLEMMHHQPTVEIDPADITVIENEEENENG